MFDGPDTDSSLVASGAGADRRRRPLHDRNCLDRDAHLVVQLAIERIADRNVDDDGDRRPVGQAIARAAMRAPAFRRIGDEAREVPCRAPSPESSWARRRGSTVRPTCGASDGARRRSAARLAGGHQGIRHHRISRRGSGLASQRASSTTVARRLRPLQLERRRLRQEPRRSTTVVDAVAQHERADVEEEQQRRRDEEERR